MKNNKRTILFTRDEIAERLREITAKALEKLPPDAGEIVLVPLLNGAATASRMFAMFVEDTFGGCGPCLGGPAITEKPMTIKRSDGTELRTPELKEFQYTREDFEGKFVVIIDDLVDEGETLKLAWDTICSFNPSNLISVVVVKKSNIDTDSYLTYACFELNYPIELARKRWLYGFGIDMNGEHRDLDYIEEIQL
ncbi:MAG: phosphoribosyltransferase family protein [Nitrospinota bacterium]|nr:phosphoribosyltransferase family protein [Nitrospinota bacterium]